MSAPLTVNTRDGVCWTRRTVTSGGIALYAPEGVCKCPEFVMATLPELTEHGIVGSADVLPVPVPVGPLPQTARQKVDEAFGIEARLFQHALDKVFSVLAEGGFLAAPSQTAALRARIAELEAERHETNEALDDAVQELRARPVEEPSTGCYPPALPWAKLMDREDLADFLDELAASAITHASSDVALAEVEKTCGAWRLIAEAQHGHNTAPGPDAMSQVFAPVASLREVSSREEPHDSPLHHDYRVGHDLPETGGAQ